MELAYITKPLSALDIELDSSIFLKEYQPRVLEGKEPLNVEQLLDDIYIDKGFSLLLVEDDEFPKEILGISEMDNKLIKIRESDYNKCDKYGYSRMTVTHEVGHSRLHSEQFEKNKMQMYRTQSDRIAPYKSSEWQARVWASATLMPFTVITQLIRENSDKSRVELIEAIARKFIVSISAAQARLETIERYSSDGRYQKIEKAIKKELDKYYEVFE